MNGHVEGWLHGGAGKVCKVLLVRLWLAVGELTGKAVLCGQHG